MFADAAHTHALKVVLAAETVAAAQAATEEVGVPAGALAR